VKTPSATEPGPGTFLADEGKGDAVLSEILDPLCETLESGILVVGHDQRIAMASLAMSVMFGKTPEDLVGLAATDFNALALPLMDDPPKRLKESGLFPTSSPVLCEEFELSRPSRTVARWIARKVRCRFYATVAVAADITADVDLNSAYEKMATTDRLTGLMNRRGLERDIRHELLRLRRYQTPISFVLLDIDHFKAVNDTHGHVAGDEVLRQVAKAIASSVRETDLVARWGGEEFLVVLPETAYTGALICAEKIRLKVAAVGEQVGFPVTISGGAYQPGPGESISDLLTRADARLYEAKRTGRNRIC
jgi:diguanylate cyclase (GGDEF)-like protein